MHNDRKWWKESVIYQLYPRSFQDSDGDGIGDLRGILKRMDYLEQLGVGAIWLNPIYKSPNDDMGYDISDYQDIMDEFGTMEDFDELLAAAHRHGIRIIMDLVVNHSSDEHAWFMEARQSKDNPYRDFYIWRKGKGTAPGEEPNNWASFFTPSAWTYDAATDEYYLHLFSQKQPDLNWENPRLREEVYRMMNWWMDKGIDGFRMDVINLIAKEEGLPDGASSGPGYVFCPEHFANQEKLHDYLQEMRRRCFDGRDAMCVGETPFSSPETGSRLMDPDNRELDMIFQDALMEVDSGEGGKWNVIPFSLREWKRRVRIWQQVAEDTWGSLFWSNHDQPRPLSRFVDLDAAAGAALSDDASEPARGSEDLPAGSSGSGETYAAMFETLRTRAAKMLGAAMHLMRGTSYIYQGEEIGMLNMPFESPDDLRDIESINFYHEELKKGADAAEKAFQAILKKGRDNARTPMQWDDSSCAGFTEGGEPWEKVNPNYVRINAARQRGDPDSVLAFYQKLIRFKQTDRTAVYGAFRDLLPEDDDLFAYERALADAPEEGFLVICNFSGAAKMIPETLREDIRRRGGELLFSNIRQSDEAVLQPFELRVIR